MSDELKDMRENYKKGSIDVDTLLGNPFQQFLQWFDEAKVSSVPEANAMLLSTATPDGIPSSRTVLLKGIDEGFVFYTNYNSQKGSDLGENPNVSLLFLWKELERQVRINGLVKKVERKVSEKYFKTRPRASKLGAWVSNQSEVIASRDVLEESLEAMEEQYPEGTPIPCPPHWGGYIVLPKTIEFWQGRPSRLHDRIRYRMEKGKFVKERLAP